ncbi:MAG: hypothetical protein AB7T63_17460 [Planctomycetota bacterium]
MRDVVAGVLVGLFLGLATMGALEAFAAVLPTTPEPVEIVGRRVHEGASPAVRGTIDTDRETYRVELRLADGTRRSVTAGRELYDAAPGPGGLRVVTLERSLLLGKPVRLLIQAKPLQIEGELLARLLPPRRDPPVAVHALLMPWWVAAGAALLLGALGLYLLYRVTVTAAKGGPHALHLPLVLPVAGLVVALAVLWWAQA